MSSDVTGTAGARKLPQRRIRATACAAMALLVLASCTSIHPDRFAASAGSKEVAAIAAFDERMLGLRLSPDAARLASLRAELDAAAGQSGLTRQLVARVDALSAEAALLAGDTAGARGHLAEAAALSEAEEGVWFVRARLEASPAKRLALLNQGIARADTTARLLCERGRAFLAAKRYAEAAQDLDEGLRALDARYVRLYGADRDKAMALAKAVRSSGTTPLQTQGLSEPLTVRSMVERTASSTQLLSGMSPDKNPSFAALLPALKTAGLLLDPAASPGSRAPRKTVAWFLWGIVARVQHDPGLLTKYRLKYTTSPVPDVAAKDPWFDAVLGTVEAGIMDLPDGVHFKPNDPVTGFELVAMLAQVKLLSP